MRTHILLLATVLWVNGGSLSAETQPEDRSKTLAEMKKRFEAGDLDAAATGLKAHLEKNPKDEEASALFDEVTTRWVEIGHELLTAEKRTAEDLKKAILLFEKAAGYGKSPAMFNLGLIHVQGKVVKADYAKARDWFLKAAACEHPKAMLQLGCMCAEGEGGAKDPKEAEKWFRKAVATGSPYAQREVGILYMTGDMGLAKNPKEGLRLLTLAAEQKDVDAQFNIGLVHYNGQGIPVDHAAALKGFRVAAESGHPQAQAMLGCMYAQGQGVGKADLKEAAAWYRKSAEQGLDVAQYTFGLFCLNGTGVPRNKDEGIRWLKAAAEQGHTDAQRKLKELGIEF
jgi:hypothetical protein